MALAVIAVVVARQEGLIDVDGVCDGATEAVTLENHFERKEREQVFCFCVGSIEPQVFCFVQVAMCGIGKLGVVVTNKRLKSY